MVEVRPRCLDAERCCNTRRWRLQAEVAMRAKGKPGMTDEQVAAFVDRYMPAYRAYLTGLYEKGPTTGKKGLVLNIDIDPSRAPIGAQII